VRVAIVGQDLPCNEPFNKVQGFARSDIIAVDNLSTAIWSIKDCVTTNDVVIDVIGELWNLKEKNITKLLFAISVRLI